MGLFSFFEKGNREVTVSAAMQEVEPEKLEPELPDNSQELLADLKRQREAITSQLTNLGYVDNVLHPKLISARNRLDREIEGLEIAMQAALLNGDDSSREGGAPNQPSSGARPVKDKEWRG